MKPMDNIRTPYKKMTLGLIAVAVFLVALSSHDVMFHFDAYKRWVHSLPRVLRWLDDPIRSLLLCMGGVYFALRIPPWRAFRELGLTGSFGTGLLLGFVASLPMLLGGLLWGTVSVDESALGLLFVAAVWPLSEEILFRGYAFRQMYRRAGWNLWIAAIATGLTFGLVHLTVASVANMPWSDQMGTVAIIGVGGVLWAWIFARWDDNLWVVWSIHGFMNLWWSVFDMSDDPLGGWGPNIMRVLTVALAILITRNRHRLADSTVEASAVQGDDR